MYDRRSKPPSQASTTSPLRDCTRITLRESAITPLCGCTCYMPHNSNMADDITQRSSIGNVYCPKMDIVHTISSQVAIRRRIQTNTNPYGTEANAAGRVGMHMRCANKTSAEWFRRERGTGQIPRKICKKRGICGCCALRRTIKREAREQRSSWHAENSVERVHPRLIRDSPENLFAQCDQNWIGLGQTGAMRVGVRKTTRKFMELHNELSRCALLVHYSDFVYNSQNYVTRKCIKANTNNRRAS